MLFFYLQIDLGLDYSEIGSKITIEVFSAKSLVPVNPYNPYSDPYVKIKVLKDNQRYLKYETSTKWESLSPEWNEK